MFFMEERVSERKVLERHPWKSPYGQPLEPCSLEMSLGKGLPEAESSSFPMYLVVFFF